MPTLYRVCIDWNDEGAFPPDQAITKDILALSWRLGMAAPHDSVATPATAEITLLNTDRRYSPEHSTLPLQPGKALCIESHDGTTLRRHFTGYISHIQPQTGIFGERTALIYAEGLIQQLHQIRVQVPPQVDVRADEVIREVLTLSPLRRPALRGYWILQQAGHSELGQTTRLVDRVPVDTSQIQSGISRFAYVGDTWNEGISAINAIREVAEAERGRFFENRDGQPVFHNRHEALLPAPTAASFTDDMNGLHYDYGRGTVSSVKVRLRPRYLSPPLTRLWRLEQSQLLPFGRGQSQLIQVSFRDANDRPAGALSVEQPTPWLDYAMNTRPDGQGTDLTAQAHVVLLKTHFSGATLRITNHSTQQGYLLEGAQLRGQAVYQGDPLLVEQSHNLTALFYGSDTLFFDLPALQSIDEAENLARFELARRKTPRGQLYDIQLEGPAHHQAILSRTLFDNIHITEAQSAHQSAYRIIAEAHQVTQGGTRHQVTWTLEPAELYPFWQVERNHLNQSTRLAY